MHTCEISVNKLCLLLISNEVQSLVYLHYRPFIYMYVYTKWILDRLIFELYARYLSQCLVLMMNAQ